MSPRPGPRLRAGRNPTHEIAGLQAISETVIYPHIFANADREVGGVLIGRPAAGGSLPLLTGAIPAISADEQRATLTFTQEAWAHVHRVLERDFPPDEQIVGWYHSHPGFGIFLSGHDLFIHENFFNAPSQIAVVIDPHAQTEGTFAWQIGELKQLFERPTPSAWRAHPAMGLSNQAATNSSRHSQPSAPEPRYPLLALAIAAVLGVLIGFGIWSVAEGSTSAKAPVQHGSPSTRTRAVRTTAAPQSNIEVRK
jgi:proteasome lid subunit RPN8/RPN11